MKFSNDTMNILKNFSLINQSILFKPGNQLRTTNGAAVFAEATIAETIPTKAPIWDLPKLLSIMSIVDSPEIDFFPTYLTITSKNNVIRYAYAAESLIKSPPDKSVVVKDTFAELDLSWESIDKILKAVSILRTDVLTFKSEDSKVLLTTSTKNSSGNYGSDSFTVSTDVETSNNFKLDFKPDNFKIIADNYKVKIDTRKFINLQSDKVNYFISAEIE